MTDSSRYEQRGVSSSKSEVHAAVENLDKGIFPEAFCKILPDELAGDLNYCNIQHADGAGTKSSLAYLVWKLTGRLDVWEGITRDSLFMNLDDMGCAGAMGPFLISLSIGRNKMLIPGEVIKSLIQSCDRVCSWLTGMGIVCKFTGGETADIGDLVRTIVVDNTVTTRFRREEVVDAGRIRPGALIVGFSSTGQASYETEPNSSMGSNGLTNSRHDMLSSEYWDHKETYSPEMPQNLVYQGEYLLTDKLPGDGRFTIASALLSPTRTYLPLLHKLFYHIERKKILGLIHCSGGGQTKIGKFGPKGIKYVKNNLFPIPPLFQELQSVQKLPMRQMYESYNMGHRLEAVVDSEWTAQQCIKVASTVNIDAQVIGYVTDKDVSNPQKRYVVIGDEEPYEF